MLNGKFGVTCSRNARGSEPFAEARALATELGAVYVERAHDRTLTELLREQGLSALIVMEKDGPRVHSEAGTFAYHPSMALLRIQQMLNGGHDHFVEALGVREGARVLDCTLGLASDAAVAAFAVGATGRVVGLEASPLVHFAVSYGLQHYESKAPLLTQALRRIEALRTEAGAYLTRCAEDSFDVVYFDPMFKRPVAGSRAMDALRPLAYAEPLNAELVRQALRVAPRVVIKERAEYLLAELGCREFVGGRYSRVKYGILRR